MKKIELLAPAKNYEYGVAAIDCGADAVYIGAERFGARYAAGNTISDIAALSRYAHLFGAKVYVTMNTILYDDEIADAQRLACDLWDAGVDALIVQDMAFMKMTLPPIELFASTQTVNTSAERVRFLEESGFSRIILERSLSLDEIKSIRSSTQVDLEMFVHGAICVSNSGECYMSHVVAQRSGNRGVCAQPCRSSYNLLDEDFNMIRRNKHFLSVQDLSLEDHIEDLIEAGITSFKIEGRLKDISYIKNIVAHYNSILNKVVDSCSDLKRASDGRILLDFTPNIEKTFSRRFTPYFIDGIKRNVSSFNTPKAMGEKVGIVTVAGRDYFELDNKDVKFIGGDGICFLDEKGEFLGTNINKHEGHRVFPNRTNIVSKGIEIYRNYDKTFLRFLETNRCRRVLDADVTVVFTEKQITLSIYNENFKFRSVVENVFEEAKNHEKARDNFLRQMNKGGDSIFEIGAVYIDGNVPFIPISAINDMRRIFLCEAQECRTSGNIRSERTKTLKKPQMKGVADYRYNIVNSLSEKFYRECGVERVDRGVELMHSFDGVDVMTSKYCIRKEIGECLKEGGKYKKLYLENNRRLFELKFDCKDCKMRVVYKENVK